MGELEEGGVFIFNSNEREKIDALKMKIRSTTIINQIDVVAYLIELVYDLETSPADNVSNNPGFESCLGIW